MSIRAVLYARMSDRKNEETRLDDQILDCREYAEKRGYEVVHELQEEPGLSGADTERPQLLRARQLAREGKFDVLIAIKPSRFWRESDEMDDERRRFKEHDVNLEYALRQYVDGWQGVIQEKEDAVAAEKYRMEVREKTTRGRRNAAKRGNVHCAGHPPYGYREATVDGKRTLVIHEEEAEVVRTIFQLYRDGNGNGKKFGCKSIARYLTERNIPSHSDKGNTINNKAVSDYGTWDHHPVMRMLKAPVYKGEWQYGKHTDNPITITVPRIISDEDWEAAQVIRKKNRRVRKYSGQYDFMLQGDVYCSLCGKPMSPQMKRGPKVAYSYYIHRPHPVHHSTNGNRCTGHANYSAKAVDDAVWAYTKKILSNPGVLAGGFRKYAERLKSGNHPTRDKLGAAVRKTALIVAAIGFLVVLQSACSLSDSSGSATSTERPQASPNETVTPFYQATKEAILTVTSPPHISGLQDYGRHVGRYPCDQLGEPGLLLKAPVLQGELRNVLGTEYEDFLGHLDHSTCVPIQRHGSYLLLHIFQPHVHTDNTVIMIRETDGALFLLWLKSILPEADLRLYSREPIQNRELLEFARVMNITWGHVACFEPEGRTLRIDTGRYANQDTGECLGVKSPN